MAEKGTIGANGTNGAHHSNGTNGADIEKPPAVDAPVGTPLATTHDVDRIEAPVTWKAYLICAFASFGGIFFGYDSGYINGVNGSKVFVHLVENSTTDALASSHQSLIVSILSAGTFFGAIAAGD